MYQAGWKLEDLEQQRRPVLGDEDCPHWKPGCSCFLSDEDDEEDDDDDDYDDDDFDDDDNIGGLWCAQCTSSNGLRAGHDLPAPTAETLLHITTLRTPVQEIVTPFLQLLPLASQSVWCFRF